MVKLSNLAGVVKRRQILLELVGWFGFVGILSAYAVVSLSLVPPDSLLYQFPNLVGSVALVVYTLAKRAYPNSALNIVWGIIAAIAIVKMTI